jgi:hypothetical protein
LTSLAVIGTELAGLVTAHLCAKAGHKVVHYPQAAGPTPAEPPYALTHFATSTRLMTPSAAPETFALCRALGVPTLLTDPGVSFTFIDGPTWLKLGSPQNRRQNLPRLGSLDLANRHSATVALGLGRLPPSGSIPADQTFDEFAADERLPEVFYRAFLLPLLSTFNGLDEATLRTSPARPLVTLTRLLTRGRPMRAMLGGAQALHDRLSRGLELGAHARVASVTETPQGLKVQTETGHSRLFDRVIVATPPNQAGFLDATQFGRERTLLAYLRHELVDVVTHRDLRFMPAQETHWAPVNIAITRTLTRAAPTYWLNPILPQPGVPRADARPLLQSVGPLFQPLAETVVARARLARPVVDRDSMSARRHLERGVQTPGRRLFFALSLSSPGVPPVEEAIARAKRLAAVLGA